MRKRADGKLSGKNEEKILNDEMNKPTYYLLGYHAKRRKWVSVVRGLISFRRGAEMIDSEDPRYTRMMMVSQVEFRALGMPKTEAATEYFTIEGQRSVSDYYGQNKASRRKKR